MPYRLALKLSGIPVDKVQPQCRQETEKTRIISVRPAKPTISSQMSSYSSPPSNPNIFEMLDRDCRTCSRNMRKSSIPDLGTQNLEFHFKTAGVKGQRLMSSSHPSAITATRQDIEQKGCRQKEEDVKKGVIRKSSNGVTANSNVANATEGEPTCFWVACQSR